ncbi:hypothetical protein ACFLT9_08660 [Acidobacteriota bacterium]
MSHSKRIESRRWSFIAFILRSLFHEYGLAFLFRVVIFHPLKALTGLGRILQMDTGPPSEPTPKEISRFSNESIHIKKGIVGLGFCLKPIDPDCPSGRANHDCILLEKAKGGLANGDTDFIPEPCSTCLILDIGIRALSAGWSFYIMTSAADILHDLLLPALRKGSYRQAILGLCGFSFSPFLLALEICGISSLMYPFQAGDCKDYKSWRQADIGIKEERTELDPIQVEKILLQIDSTRFQQLLPADPIKIGHVFSPGEISFYSKEKLE